MNCVSSKSSKWTSGDGVGIGFTTNSAGTTSLYGYGSAGGISWTGGANANGTFGGGLSTFGQASYNQMPSAGTGSINMRGVERAYQYSMGVMDNTFNKIPELNFQMPQPQLHLPQSGGILRGGAPITGDNIFVKTYDHFQRGGGNPVSVDASSLNFGKVTQKDLVYNPRTGDYGLDLYKTNPASQAALALGKITLVSAGKNQYYIQSDYYDFNIEWQRGFSRRNIATAADGFLHYNLTSLTFGGPYWINFHGTTTINP